MTDIIRRKSSGEAWETVADTGGSGGGESFTHSLTTDPDTFTVELVVDYEGFALSSEKIIVTDLVPDGETFGPTPGTISPQVQQHEVSFDGVTYLQTSPDLYQPGLADSDNGYLDEVGQFAYYGIATPRFVKITVIIADNDGMVYAGANHPQASVDIEFSAVVA